jgi:protein-S-isoprenylcysteine O-methyltransferase Ste14
MRESFTARGGGWVVAQSVLLLGVVASGVIWAGQWHQPAAFALGVVLFACAGALGAFGLRDLGRSRTAFPRPIAQATLVRTGLYGLVRHPLYASVFLGSLSWALLWSSLPALISSLVLLVFFDAKARTEERWLRQRYPEYAAYARQVRRLIPWIY